MALVVFIVLPIACAYPFFQRFVVAGLTVMKNIVIWSCGALKNKKEETQYA